MDQLYTYFDVDGGSSYLDSYGWPDVHKFDASAFYNWEQDNLPILDLENRSNILRQYLGLNTDLSGVTLTVSADAPQSASSVGVFPTVQKALEVIPRRLRFPLLIEITDFGDLGVLELEDIHCEGEGALQIVGRQYAADGAADGNAVVGSYNYGPSEWQSLPTIVESPRMYAQIEEASSTNLVVNCSSVDLWDRHARCYFQKRNSSQYEAQTPGFSPFPRPGGMPFKGGGADTIQFSGYSIQDDVTVSADVNPKSAGGLGASLIEERLLLESSDRVNAIAYGLYAMSYSFSGLIHLLNILIIIVIYKFQKLHPKNTELSVTATA